ncbi:uncharacterized protein LOC115988042 isoform X3 [Quercus lobata]|uniref:uncharacterized protein LOC115988042 isoform X3 n=1 Tax=Quercus lobata TaxID=97700 RepID=UPI00124465D5|nr:uncharacterized protein LOC115988042 isoform X3 [Quercus lobata]
MGRSTWKYQVFFLFSLILHSQLPFPSSLSSSLSSMQPCSALLLFSLLPSSLFNLPNLSTLGLGNNQLVGPLPSHLIVIVGVGGPKFPPSWMGGTYYYHILKQSLGADSHYLLGRFHVK